MGKGQSSTANFYGTFTAIIIIVAALIFVDLMLVRVDRNEREQEAVRYFTSGEQYFAAGDFDRAVDSFRSAFSINREDLRAQLAFAQALYSAGRLAEAESTARELLASDPANADASLIMARILVGRSDNNGSGTGSQEEGLLFYHRAIFGRWTENTPGDPVTPAQRELRTRLELTDILARNGAGEALLAELLPLRDVAEGNLDLLRRIAPLYISAGAPERGAELYREILDEVPNDAPALAGLGDAQFAQGNYRDARRSFETALRFDPGNPSVERRLELTNQIRDLDPLGRDLRLVERYERSRMLLEMVLTSLNACIGPEPSSLATTLIEAAEEALAREVTVEERNDAVDQNLNLSENIWDLRVEECGDPPASEEPISLVLSRAAQ